MYVHNLRHSYYFLCLKIQSFQARRQTLTGKKKKTIMFQSKIFEQHLCIQMNAKNTSQLNPNTKSIFTIILNN